MAPYPALKGGCLCGHVRYIELFARMHGALLGVCGHVLGLLGLRSPFQDGGH